MVFFTLAAALIAIVAMTLGRLPPLVASHFNFRGVPDGWSSRPVYAGFILAVGILVPLSIVWLITVLTRAGVESLNIPARDYWNQPVHSGEAVRRVRAYIWWLACVIAVITLLIHWSVLEANARQPPGLGIGGFFIILGAAVAVIGIWTAGWYRLMRCPT